ncbi:MAG: Autophagy protein 22 [Bathelium mastoideum]|nr:MAG: Autophagy protein 22 [Bathelium mastoideum]
MPFGRRSLHYIGEDTQLTSQRELWGWYSYGLAAEVFAVCGVGSFLPVTLEQLAREHGLLLPDRSTPCVPRSSNPPAGDLVRRDDNQCVIYVLGHEINTSSFSLYSFSLAILVQTLVLISIGAIADYGSNRKKFLLAFSSVGAAASMLFILVVPEVYLVGVFLTIISVACLGSSFVLLNSFLPLLVSNHSSIRSRSESASVPLNADASENDEDDPFDGDLAAIEPIRGEARLDAYLESRTVSPSIQLSNQISAKGVGIGYAAAVVVQIIGISIILVYSKLLKLPSTSTLPMRTVLFVVGLWWACFTVPTALWLRRRPGPPLPFEVDSKGRFSVTLQYITFAWFSLWQTIRVAWQLRQVVIFLAGWFLLSDGIATVSGTAILFARTELKLGTAAIALLSITATAAGIAGSFCWPKIADKYDLKPISVLLCCIFMYEFILLYGLVGFIPFVKGLGVGGLQQWWEIYPLGFLLGFIMGGISSYCRAVFGNLIPPGMEAAFYSLYAVTDKGSSVIGPTIAGRIIDVTGSIRMGFWFLAVLMISPAPFFWFVDVERGRSEALAMAGLKRRTDYTP